ncbi:uncharacterized protein FYN16_014821 [Cariama cristata]
MVQEQLRGQEEVYVLRRPVFQLDIDALCLHELTFPTVIIPGHIKIKVLNYKWLSQATSFPWQLVKCVQETILLYSFQLRNRQRLAFAFKDIGVLSYKDKVLCMWFYSDCITGLESKASWIALFPTRLWMPGGVVSAGATTAQGMQAAPAHAFPRFQLRVISRAVAKAFSTWHKKAAEKHRLRREAVDARWSGLRWSNHRSGDAGCSCPRVPKVSVAGDQQSSGQGFLHLAQEGCRKAQAQKRGCGCQVEWSPLEQPPLRGCRLLLPTRSQGAEVHSDELLQRRVALSLPMLPSQGSGTTQEDTGKKPSGSVLPPCPGSSPKMKETGRKEPAPPARPTAALPSSEGCKRALQEVWQLSAEWEQVKTRWQEQQQQAKAEWAVWEAWLAGEDRQLPQALGSGGTQTPHPPARPRRKEVNERWRKAENPLPAEETAAAAQLERLQPHRLSPRAVQVLTRLEPHLARSNIFKNVAEIKRRRQEQQRHLPCT